MVLSPRVTGYARSVTVKVYDTGDLDDEDDVPEEPIGPAYWSQNMQGSPIPDVWPAWREDFFMPAARLMTTAPWLFVRGNHELCSRAGPGWFYLLDPGSALLGGARNQEHCPPQTPAGWQPGAWPQAQPFDGQSFPVRISPPMRLKLGDLDIISIDSANAGDVYVYNLDAYVEQFRQVASILSERRPTWLVTHRPFWGVVKRINGGPAGQGEPYGFINVTEQAGAGQGLSRRPAVQRHGGHVGPHAPLPGDRLWRSPPAAAHRRHGRHRAVASPAGAAVTRRQAAIQVPKLDGIDAAVVGLMDFGAMVLEPGKAGAWTGAMVSETGRVLATCDSAWPRQGRDKSVCRLR